ncbi:M3 family oligoendopeptidase [Paenibacillus alkalitolerans]|uniref:M3 family oligoendopeptidase n=1 Tax=Paenibacillus alkalitolerans TaxID=2799335 RepID=UPI0018F5DBC8|nr:M3 family oligoendopeptidase [Paenibacillus alkalitolerans]
MSESSTSAKYYSDTINLEDTVALEARLNALLQQEVTSAAALEEWLAEERKLRDEITEAMTGHRIDFDRDTANAGKRDIHLHGQTVVQPLLTKYVAEFDKKFCGSPFIEQLEDKKHGLMRKVRRAKVELFREENIPLTVREQELVTRYNEIMGVLTVEWDGETKPYPLVQAQADIPDRTVRERAWRALAEARGRVKPEIDDIMNELVRLRHRMALNAGFGNYRDYIFTLKNREYSIQDCYDFHTSVEKHVVPAWERLAEVFRTGLGIDSYRPWDTGPCTLQGEPFRTVTELLDGVDLMLGMTDTYFQEKFRFMRANGLLDVECRQGKRPGAFCDSLPASKNVFVFSKFSPSFVAVIALIHEMGHAVNEYLQFDTESGIQAHNHREEVAELYSHAMELLLLDKLNVFYTDDQEFKNAQREELRRTFNVLINPVAGDLFQHWMYTNPNHSAEERDAKFLEINKRFMLRPVDIMGLESEIGAGWIGSIHYFAYPFYKIEYAMSELGALQLLQIYREDPAKATALFKQGAGSDFNQSIAQIYRDTGVEFDFSEQTVEKTAKFVESVIAELQ